MSGKNLKEHRSFYKWIKHYGAILVEMKKAIDELNERIDMIERRARDNYFAWCYGEGKKHD